MKKIIILFGILLSFSSCFKSYVQLDITSKWDDRKMKALISSNKEVEVYFTNKLAVISNPELEQDQIQGVVSTFQPMNLSHLSYSNGERPTDIIKNAGLPEVQIFISEEFKDQDTVVINRSNFMQMRQYKPDHSATIFSYIGAALGLVTMLILISGIAVYYAYLTSNITSTL
jgi:hypothetical protein